VAQLRRLQALADAYYAPAAQLAGGPEEEDLVQGQFASAELPAQLQQTPRANNTGLPDQLKSGIESLSGMSMDDVRVHFNSSQPAQLNALAYAQGCDIHLAPGQERHLPHEAWHVVQQAQGRVRPTLQLKDGVPVNDDVGLEREADEMGSKALEGGHRADEAHRSISMPIETAQQIEGDTTNSPNVKVANNDSAPLANSRGSAQRGGNEVQRIADQRPEAAFQRQVQAWGDGSERVAQLRAWHGVADGRGLGGKRQDLTPGFVPSGGHVAQLYSMATEGHIWGYGKCTGANAPTFKFQQIQASKTSNPATSTTAYGVNANQVFEGSPAMRFSDDRLMAVPTRDKSESKAFFATQATIDQSNTLLHDAGAPLRLIAGAGQIRLSNGINPFGPTLEQMPALAKAAAAADGRVLQARFDPQDIDRMRAVALDDSALSKILEEVIAIHDRMPEDLNYGVTSKGGHAGLNSQGKGQVVVKDERWAITRRIKDYFNAYGMEHDIKRQSMIIHELTHLAELYANLPSDGGVVPEDKRPKSDKELAKSMEPEKALVDEVYLQKDAVEKLLDDSDYDGSMKTYLRGRLEYGFAINAENPTVFTEIGYYLAAHGKRGTAFYDKIMEFAKKFFSSRQQRLAKPA
jgi:hypothetical protein